MKSIDMIKSRHTTKAYDKTYQIPAEIRQNIIDILRYSPSSINSQPWRFYLVENKDIKQKLAKASFFNQEKIEEASLLIVFSALKPATFEQQLMHHGAEGSKMYFNTNIKQKTAAEISSWIAHQVYISLGFLLACLGLEGIDSTSLEGIDPPAYMKILNLNPEEETVLFALAVGKRKNTDENHPSIKGKVRLDQTTTVKEIL